VRYWHKILAKIKISKKVTYVKRDEKICKILFSQVKGKYTFVENLCLVFQAHVMKAYRGRRGTAPLISNSVLDKEGWLTSRHVFLLLGKNLNKI
jgi:hypothetical protein